MCMCRNIFCPQSCSNSTIRMVLSAFLDRWFLCGYWPVKMCVLCGSGLPEDFSSKDYRPCAGPYCFMEQLCELHDGLVLEAKGVKEHFWKPFIKKLFHKRVRLAAMLSLWFNVIMVTDQWHSQRSSVSLSGFPPNIPIFTPQANKTCVSKTLPFLPKTCRVSAHSGQSESSAVYKR